MSKIGILLKVLKEHNSKVSNNELLIEIKQFEIKTYRIIL